MTMRKKIFFFSSSSWTPSWRCFTLLSTYKTWTSSKRYFWKSIFKYCFSIYFCFSFWQHCWSPDKSLATSKNHWFHIWRNTWRSPSFHSTSMALSRQRRRKRSSSRMTPSKIKMPMSVTMMPTMKDPKTKIMKTYPASSPTGPSLKSSSRAPHRRQVPQKLVKLKVFNSIIAF